METRDQRALALGPGSVLQAGRRLDFDTQPGESKFIDADGGPRRIRRRCEEPLLDVGKNRKVGHRREVGRKFDHVSERPACCLEYFAQVLDRSDELCLGIGDGLTCFIASDLTGYEDQTSAGHTYGR